MKTASQAKLITSKQREFLLQPAHRINLLEGSVRSGKTYISVIAWCFFVAAMPKEAQFLMVGKTLTTLKRNCLNLLADIEPSFQYSISAKAGKLYGRTIWLEGADNDASESKIRGMTLTGAYVDELTLIPKGFYEMLLSRLSAHGAKLYATTNPDSPNHYVYTDIIKNEALDKQVTKFHITDNEFLDPEYVANLAKEYTGMFYQRFFLGEWVLAEGLVYPMYDNTVQLDAAARYDRYVLSMDYGILNPTAMLLFGHNERDGIWYAIREYYHSGRETNDQKTDEQYYTAMVGLLDGIVPEKIIIDPSASSYITLIRQRHEYRVMAADNDVGEGIRHTASAISQHMVLVSDACKRTIGEFGLYSWDEKAADDTVIKENDHAMDALRYFVQTMRIYKKRDAKANLFGGEKFL